MNASPEQLSQRFDTSDVKKPLSPTSEVLENGSSKTVIAALPTRLRFPGDVPPGACRSRPRCCCSAYPGRPPGPVPPKTAGVAILLPSRYPGEPPPKKCPPIKRVATSVQQKPSVTSKGSRGPPRRPPPPLIRPSTALPSNLLSLPDFPQPPKGHIPRRLQWQNLGDARTKGSIWESLLLIDDLPKLPSSTSQFSCESPNFSQNALSLSATKALPTDSLPTATRGKSAKLCVDYSKLNVLFFENPVPKRKSGSDPTSDENLESGALDSQKGWSDNSGAAKRTFVTVLDPKRRQNVEICLKGLGLLDDMSPLLHTVLDLVAFQDANADSDSDHTGHLSPENLQLVISLYPTREEEKALRDIDLQMANNSAMRIGKAEEFLLRLLKIDGFRARAECCVLRMTLLDELHSVAATSTQLNCLVSKVLDTLQHGALRSVLAFILNAGNYLNHGSRKGKARGFSLNCLTQLKSVKSVDNSTTLLRVVAEAIETQQPSAWDELRQSIGVRLKLPVSWMEDTGTTLRQIHTKLARIDKEVENMRHDPLFVSVFSKFKQSASEQLKTVEQQVQDAEVKLLRLNELCAERGKTTKTGLELLKQLECFWKDLHTAYLENREAEKRSRNQASREARSTNSTNTQAQLTRSRITEKALTSKTQREDALQHLSSSDTTQSASISDTASERRSTNLSQQLSAEENGSSSTDSFCSTATATEISKTPSKQGSTCIAALNASQSFVCSSAAASGSVFTAEKAQKAVALTCSPVKPANVAEVDPLSIKSKHFLCLSPNIVSPSRQSPVSTPLGTTVCQPEQSSHTVRIIPTPIRAPSPDEFARTTQPSKTHPKVPKLMMDRLLSSCSKKETERSFRRATFSFRESASSRPKVLASQLWSTTATTNRDALDETKANAENPCNALHNQFESNDWISEFRLVDKETEQRTPVPYSRIKTIETKSTLPWGSFKKIAGGVQKSISARYNHDKSPLVSRTVHHTPIALNSTALLSKCRGNDVTPPSRQTTAVSSVLLAASPSASVHSLSTTKTPGVHRSRFQEVFFHKKLGQSYVAEEHRTPRVTTSPFVSKTSFLTSLENSPQTAGVDTYTSTRAAKVSSHRKPSQSFMSRALGNSIACRTSPVETLNTQPLPVSTQVYHLTKNCKK